MAITILSFAAFIAAFLQLGTLIGVSEATISGRTSFGDIDSYLDDIPAIRSLYGASRQTRDSQSNHNAGAGKGAKLPDFCQRTFRLDAFAQGGDGCMYAFRKTNVYKVCRDRIDADYPKAITQVFPGGPKKRIGAASFASQNKKFYIFDKRLSVWRFSHIPTRQRTDPPFQLDKGYPKRISSDKRYKPLAAITMNTKEGKSQILFFSGKKKDMTIWKWNVEDESMETDIKIEGRLKRLLRKAPKGIDAAFLNQKGDLLFFKRNKYKSLSLNKRKKSNRSEKKRRNKKMSIGPNLFGPACGGSSNATQLSDY